MAMNVQCQNWDGNRLRVTHLVPYLILTQQTVLAIVHLINQHLLGKICSTLLLWVASLEARSIIIDFTLNDVNDTVF